MLGKEASSLPQARNTFSIVSLFVVANKTNTLPSETKMDTPTLKVLLPKSR